MKKPNSCDLVFFLILFSLSGLQAQDFPSLEPDPKAFEYAGRVTSGLTWADLAEISLWASGTDPFADSARGGPSYMQILENAVLEIRNDRTFPREKREQGEYILDFMFKKFLKRYSERQTRMDTLLSNGSYNCVSSSVLYLILASSVELDAEGAITKDHAFVRFLAETGEIDIETTNPYGFDPGNRRDFHDEFGRLTGYAYVPARNYRDRADINSIELVSLIFNNLITDLESRNRFDEALKLSLNRAALLSTSKNRHYPEFFIDPQKMVIDRIFNYGAILLRQGKENEALLWADMASGHPDQRWDEFVNTAMNNLLARLIRSNRYTEARKVLEDNAFRMSPSAYARFDSTLTGNRIAELHNSFAAAYNRRDFLSAKNIIERALEEFPNNHQLLADKELADQAFQ